MFQVSVIIPVYNAVNFLIEAVESALMQPEVGEVILVEDGSQDNSLEICERLSREHEKVRIITHLDGINQGVCKSRNLGIQNSNFDFIAFLDADDWYLPNRFVKDSKLFNRPEIMAVYSLSVIKFPDGKEELFGCSEDFLKKIEETNLKKVYCNIMKNDVVLGHTNANTFRKSVFQKVGNFDERLKLHEDTELWNRIARSFIFYASELGRPVSVARRHDFNSIYGRTSSSQKFFLSIWIDNIGLENLYKCEKKNIIYLYSRAISNNIKWNFLRKVIFHGSNMFLSIFQNTFLKIFYYSFQAQNPR